MPYRSTKTYGHEVGFSCAFRQWRADSHCHFIHGYAISIGFVFEAFTLDDRNWVVDFGGLKELKTQLADMFDHTTIVALDDPYLLEFEKLAHAGVINLRTMERVGCEAFALHAWELASCWLHGAGLADRVRCVSAEVREHGANSALYVAEKKLNYFAEKP